MRLAVSLVMGNPFVLFQQSTSASQPWFLTQCTALVGLTILYYDYLLTFSTEFDLFWHQEISWASFFFFLNRYLVLFGHIPTIWEYFWLSANIPYNQHICRGLSAFHQYLAVVVQAIAGIMLIMRTYALYARDCRILIFLCTVAFIGIAIGCWSIITQPTENFQSPFEGCRYPTDREEAVHLIIAWSTVMIFDSIVFILTVLRSIRMFRMLRSSLVTRLMRDGAMYFAIMSLSNIFNILTFALAQSEARGFGTSITNVLSSTLISRLYLNLRDPRLEQQSTDRNSTSLTTISQPFHAMSPTQFPFPDISLDEEGGGDGGGMELQPIPVASTSRAHVDEATFGRARERIVHWDGLNKDISP